MNIPALRRKPVISDLLRFKTAADPRVAPGGARVAFTIKAIDVTADKYTQQIHVWGPTTGGVSAVRQWTHAAAGASGQFWSPCGEWLYFVSSRKDDRSAIHRINVHGGEAELVLLPDGVSLGEWVLSPCGGKLVYTVIHKDVAAERKAAAGKSDVKPLPRVITKLHYRSEGSGFISARNPDVFLFDIETKESTPLQHGFDRTPSDFVWSPCGGKVAFSINLSPDEQRLWADQGLYAFDISEGTTVRLTEQEGPKGSLSWSPCGGFIAWVGHGDRNETWGVTNEHLWVTNVASGESIDWMSTMDITVGDTTLVDVSGRGQTGPKWSRCGQKVRVVVSDKGVISRLTLTGPNTILESRPNVAAFDVAGPDHTFLEVGWDNAGVIRFPDDSVYDPNAELLSELALVEPVEIFSKTPSGHDAPSFVLRPAADGPAPTLVYIHGGPHTMYGAQNIFFEYQVLAAAGYCVIYPNPRGSKGYGEAWTMALKGNWGVPAMEDVMAGVDDAIARGWADADRLGVVGGSYGGYLSGWIIGQTDRFKAAVPERGVYDLVSMAGTTDFPWRDTDYFPADTCGDTAAYREQSPLTYADRVVTPTMIIHSEGDLRCPVSQADQYFRAIKWADRAEVIFVRYGTESTHELSRGGVPSLRVDRQVRIHSWFSKYLLQK